MATAIPLTLSKALGYIGSGDVLVQEILDDGSLSPDIVDIGNAIVFELQSDSKSTEQISRKRESSGQVLSTSTQIQPAKCGMKTETFTIDNQRRLFLAQQEELIEEPETLTAQTIALSKSGWRQITKTTNGVAVELRNLSDSVTLTNAAGTVTYVEEQDYKVDRWAGMLIVLDGGQISDSDLTTLKLTCSTKGLHGARLLGSMRPLIRARVYYMGQNSVDLSRLRIIMWEVTMRPKGGLDFQSDKIGEIEYELQLVTPAGKKSPFIIDQY